MLDTKPYMHAFASSRRSTAGGVILEITGESGACCMLAGSSRTPSANGGHAAGTQLALYGVVVREGGPEAVKLVRHRANVRAIYRSGQGTMEAVPDRPP